ncbi:RNA polymerase sigma factor [Sediminicola luteus]|uniref:RNA polymerase subunit sigma-24 n=1 Tax=Sediminicola luteus TaxID=319238 RepID=A0A2A4G7S7_9FLAO|nr:RNA polymerase sigma factor [Sediminicola luteus]PCE63802.1 hypothetical protein B7P33_11065 [Sediminicola luteus]
METDNHKKLQAFFKQEYQILTQYVNGRIRANTQRDAEDIIQDVALKLFSGADRYAPIQNVAGFVYRSIKNKIVDVMRKNGRNPRMESIEEAQVPEFAQSLNFSNAGETDAQMEKKLVTAIHQLKPMYRDIILAIDFEGYSYREIAEETGIPEGTLMSQRHRAIAQLYKKMEIEILSK